MTDYEMVNRYLEALRGRLVWRRDKDDLISEVEDHLSASIERLEAQGMGLRDAERLTLTRFGDPDVVARAFAQVPGGGLAMPTKFTRTGGTLAVFSAGMWLLVVAAWWIAGLTNDTRADGLDGTLASVAYGVGALALLLANPLTVLAMVALHQRHGSLGMLGMAGVFFSGIGAIGSLAAWVMIGWGSFGTVGVILFGIALLNRDIAPRLPARVFAASFLCGGIVWLLSHVVGGLSVSVGFWGEDWLANELALTIGTSFLAFGLLRLGVWLRSEEPARFDVTDGPLPA